MRIYASLRHRGERQEWLWRRARCADPFFPRTRRGSGRGRNIIVADWLNNRIRKISPDGNVSTLAGSGSADFGDGQGVQAHFSSPVGVAVDGDGNMIVADAGNHRIRKTARTATSALLRGAEVRTLATGKGRRPL